MMHIYREPSVRSIKKVQNTHIAAQLSQIHGSVLDIVGAINRPQRDEVLIKEAGIPLDRALFPLLVCVERLGPIGIVELAERIGRDHTTVSRQVAKLESLGLVERQGNAADRRMRQAVVSRKGKATTERVDAARERIYRTIFATWDAGDLDELARLMRKFADAMNVEPPSGATNSKR
jgi:DNA-binding MarR family transcriptional regulator